MSRTAKLFLVVGTLGLAILLTVLGARTLPNLMGWFLIALGGVYFVGVLVVYWWRRVQFWKPRASGDTVAEERSDRSFWLITAGMLSAFYLPPIEYILLAEVLPRVFWLQEAGLLLVALGSALFMWAHRALGEFYSGHVSIITGQPLVQSGPYRFMRHPAYAGYLLIGLGLALGYSSLSGLAAILGLLLPGMLYRMNVEEKLLLEHFGEAYSRYTTRTRRLIPGIW